MVIENENNSFATQNYSARKYKTFFQNERKWIHKRKSIEKH